jgi:hypothetical protein
MRHSAKVILIVAIAGGSVAAVPVSPQEAKISQVPPWDRDRSAEERDANAIDDLVALGRIGEAHGAAMRFVQRYPAGPFTSHVSNLMGVHARPRGALPAELEAK